MKNPFFNEFACESDTSSGDEVDLLEHRSSLANYNKLFQPANAKEKYNGYDVQSLVTVNELDMESKLFANDSQTDIDESFHLAFTNNQEIQVEGKEVKTLDEGTVVETTMQLGKGIAVTRTIEQVTINHLNKYSSNKAQPGAQPAIFSLKPQISTEEQLSDEKKIQALIERKQQFASANSHIQCENRIAQMQQQLKGLQEILDEKNSMLVAKSEIIEQKNALIQDNEQVFIEKEEMIIRNANEVNSLTLALEKQTNEVKEIAIQLKKCEEQLLKKSAMLEEFQQAAKQEQIQIADEHASRLILSSEASAERLEDIRRLQKSLIEEISQRKVAEEVLIVKEIVIAKNNERVESLQREIIQLKEQTNQIQQQLSVESQWRQDQYVNTLRQREREIEDLQARLATAVTKAVIYQQQKEVEIDSLNAHISQLSVDLQAFTMSMQNSSEIDEFKVKITHLEAIVLSSQSGSQMEISKLNEEIAQLHSVLQTQSRTHQRERDNDVVKFSAEIAQLNAELSEARLKSDQVRNKLRIEWRLWLYIITDKYQGEWGKLNIAFLLYNKIQINNMSFLINTIEA